MRKKAAVASGGTNLLTNLVLIFPLFLIYQIGVLALPGVHNGADFITSELLALLHGEILSYVVVNCALGVVFLLALKILGRNSRFEGRRFIPILLESGLYAITMGSFIVLVMVDLLHIDPKLAIGPESVGLLGKIVLSCGAGVHEELLFRLIGVTGLAALGRLFGMSSLVALGFAFFTSAFLFSAAHHIVGGEPFQLGAFVYRLLCGLFFAGLFQVRGLAVAVYTHAFYDMYVLVFR